MGPEALTDVLAPGGHIASAAAHALATGAPHAEAAAAVLPLLLAQLSGVIARDGGRAAAGAAEGAEAAGGGAKEMQALAKRRRELQRQMERGWAAACKSGGGAGAGALVRALALAAVGGLGLMVGAAAAWVLEPAEGMGHDWSEAAVFAGGAW